MLTSWTWHVTIVIMEWKVGHMVQLCCHVTILSNWGGDNWASDGTTQDKNNCCLGNAIMQTTCVLLGILKVLKKNQLIILIAPSGDKWRPKIKFCLSYSQVVWAHSNHNVMIKLQSLCNVLNIGVSCAFMFVLFSCIRGTWHINPLSSPELSLMYKATPSLIHLYP